MNCMISWEQYKLHCEDGGYTNTISSKYEVIGKVYLEHTEISMILLGLWDNNISYKDIRHLVLNSFCEYVLSELSKAHIELRRKGQIPL